MTDQTVKGARALGSQSSPVNAITFLLERVLSGGINTATLVRVERAGGGTCDLLPLVPQIDGHGNTLAASVIYGCLYGQLQGGVAGIICDPVKGDIGLAVFCQRDISNVKTARGPASPGSMRTFDQADGVYLGGVLNTKPTVYLELLQNGKARIVAPGGLEVEAPSSTFSGTTDTKGAATFGATVVAKGDGTFNGHSATNHTHTTTTSGQQTSAANG